MKSSLFYKNCVIQSESFQLSQSSGWIPRYSLARQEADKRSNAAPLHCDRLDQVFYTEDQADSFAIEDAVRWIDENIRLHG
jgi:hypothetical protein